MESASWRGAKMLAAFAPEQGSETPGPPSRRNRFRPAIEAAAMVRVTSY